MGNGVGLNYNIIPIFEFLKCVAYSTCAKPNNAQIAALNKKSAQSGETRKSVFWEMEFVLLYPFFSDG